MTRLSAFALPVALALALVLSLGAPAARAGDLIEFSGESQMQIDFHVPDAALAAMLPAGWQPSVATQGPAKDANIRMVFIDRGDITGPDNKPLGHGANQLVYLIVPIKQASSGVTGQMVLAGITADSADAPGPFGVYLPASDHHMARAVVADGGATRVEESWVFAAASGERMEVHLKYQRHGAPKAAAEVKFFSAKDPAMAQIWKYERGLDIMRNATVNVGDRVTDFSYKVTGGRLGALFDGSEKVLSIDAIHWSTRAAFAP